MIPADRQYLSRLHTNAWLALLENVASPFLVGDCIAPTDVARNSAGMPTAPYAVSYPLGAARFDGSASSTDLDTDTWPTFQVTSIGSSREQAEDLRDQVRSGVVGARLSVAHRLVGPLRLIDEQPPQIDTQVTPHLFYAVDRYRAHSTPA